MAVIFDSDFTFHKVIVPLSFKIHRFKNFALFCPSCSALLQCDQHMYPPCFKPSTTVDNDAPVSKSGHHRNDAPWCKSDYIGGSPGVLKNSWSGQTPGFGGAGYGSHHHQNGDDRGKFRQLDEIIYIQNYPGYHDLSSIAEKSIEVVCDCKAASSYGSYGTLFLSHIYEDITDAATFLEGVPKEGLRIEDVLVRITVLLLVRDKRIIPVPFLQTTSYIVPGGGGASQPPQDTTTAANNALYHFGEMQRRLVEFVKKHVLLEKGLNAEYQKEYFGDEKPNKIRNDDMETKQKAMDRRATTKPPEEITAAACVDKKDRLAMARHFNEMCKVVEENAVDSVEAYMANKLKKNLQPLEAKQQYMSKSPRFWEMKIF
ncbi:hypothetical protein L1887_24087 [Cichorium endivia]|nr:hypothetical protein L1887_24087 [Cichorium endivia]